jgi:hypothetical protein
MLEGGNIAPPVFSFFLASALFAWHHRAGRL